jgi:hypothetical protein
MRSGFVAERGDLSPRCRSRWSHRVRVEHVFGRTADGCADPLVARADAFLHTLFNFVRVQSELAADVHRPDLGADIVSKSS